MIKKIFPVVLSGGKGLRLWPSSQPNFPKQFLSIENSKSLLTNTLKRIADKKFGLPTIIGNYEHRFLIKRELKKSKIKFDSILLEPNSKNTMASAILSVLHISNKHLDPLILILPADHIIANKREFIVSIKNAITLAENGFITTFGLKPENPNTSFGYIKTSSKKGEGFLIDKFIEKPNKKIATHLIKEDNCFWNSGIFFFSAKTFIEECEVHAKKSIEIGKKNYRNIIKDLDFHIFQKKHFNKFKSEPIDIALMEKTKKGAIVPLIHDWSDVGSWESIWSFKKKDDNGNVFENKNVELYDVRNSIILSKNKKVAAIGLDNMIIIEDNDGLLISKKNNDKNLKLLTERVLKKNVKNIISNQSVFRPWGEYKTIYSENGFLIKILRIYPKSKISLQYHNKRSEHWVVVQGNATVTRGEKTFILKTNESTFISKGQIHRLANETSKPLTLVEVQTGKYLKEDDIIRLEDIYGRIKKRS